MFDDNLPRIVRENCDKNSLQRRVLFSNTGEQPLPYIDLPDVVLDLLDILDMDEGYLAHCKAEMRFSCQRNTLLFYGELPVFRENENIYPDITKIRKSNLRYT